MTAQLLDSLYFEEDDQTEFFVMDLVLLPKRRSKIWRHFEKVPEQDYAESLVCSTCCWRRYVATWRLINNQLYLAEMYGRYKLLKPLPAVWVTQTIRLRQDEFMFDKLRDDNTFEMELEIANGVCHQLRVGDLN